MYHFQNNTFCVNMARTKQTAFKSTGGKTTPKQLAMVIARKEKPMRHTEAALLSSGHGRLARNPQAAEENRAADYEEAFRALGAWNRARSRRDSL